jgi:acetylornithine deacetylase/succinyl-diaminopimelate desuccinylase-like protein
MRRGYAAASVADGGRVQMGFPLLTVESPLWSQSPGWPELRLPPLVDAARAVQDLKALLEDNAPYQAKVTFEGGGGANGWNAPTTADWLEQALQSASQACFGAPCATIGQGGTIPLMSLLSQGFPKAQMMVCGVLGPKSNAHGPNEFLHVPYAKKLTTAVAQVMSQLPA